MHIMYNIICTYESEKSIGIFYRFVVFSDCKASMYILINNFRISYLNYYQIMNW